MLYLIFLISSTGPCLDALQSIDRQFYPATWQIPSRHYFLLHPHYQIDARHQSNDGYSAIAENRQFLSKVIPPPIETIKPEKEPEKHGTNDKEITNNDEIQPTKPFYYVLPPDSQTLYYNPQIQFVVPKIQTV